MTAFWCWLALLGCGQLAALLLIDAGPRIHYQHYYLPADWAASPVRMAAGLVLVAQGFAAVWQLRSLSLKWKLGSLAAAAISFATSAALSPQPFRYLAELAIASAIQLINLATLVCLMRAIPSRRWAAVRARLDRWMESDLHCALPASTVTLVTAFFSYFVYRNHPHIPDELAYIIHATYLAAGKLSLPVPPVPEAFYIDLMWLKDGRWVSPVPPGWPLVLAAGAWAGVRWLVNPVLAGINVWLTSLVAREVYPVRTRNLILLLLIASPWFLFMSMNFMTHTALMTTLLAALLGVARSRRTGSIPWAVAAGAAVGFASIIRPLDGLLCGAIAGLWALGLGGARLRMASLAAFTAAAALTGAAVLPYNAQLTGDPLQHPIMAYMDQTYHKGANSLGFGPDRGVGWPLDPYPGHTPFESLLNALLNGFSVNIELHGWATGSLWAALTALFFGLRTRLDRALVVSVLLVIGCYSLYYYSGGPEFGARYWYLTLLPLIVLSVRGLEHLDQSTEGRATAAALLLAALSLAIYVPWRAIDKYTNLLLMRHDVRELAREHHFGRSLVLVQGQSHPDYASAAIYNPLDLRPESAEPVPIYAWDRDEATRAKVLALYHDRPVWVIEGPTRTGAGFRILQAPNGTRP